MKTVIGSLVLPFVLAAALLLSACRTESPAGSEPPETPAPTPSPTDWHSGVKTDYSHLTPYNPEPELYTRLRDGAMPELVPSDGYGTLLPYVGETMYGEGGYARIQRFGLVTRSGMIVTDPVYARIYRGSYYNNASYADMSVPAYALEKLSDVVDEQAPWKSERSAVCALDGSWCTPFDYQNIVFADQVIFLIRADDVNDIDIMDYSGLLLYNTRSLACYDKIPPQLAYSIAYSYGEGLIAVPQTGGGTVYVEVLTGKETRMELGEGAAFFDGMAAVNVNQGGLYGYIDDEFKMVIEPQFSWADYFYNGRAVVQYPDGGSAVIDRKGNALLKSPFSIYRFGSNYYAVYNGSTTEYYDEQFQPITAGDGMINATWNGWFFYQTDSGVTLLNGSRPVDLPGVNGISAVVGNLVGVYKNNEQTWAEGVMTLDGKVLVPLSANTGIALVEGGKSGDIFIIASEYGSRTHYRVLDAAGTVLFSGIGNISYLPDENLFALDEETGYSYVNHTGETLFRISLLQYVPD